MKIMQDMYLQYGSSNVIEDITCINQFILVLEQNHLLDKAKLTLVESKKTVKRFLIYKSDQEREIHIGEALDTLVALNDAVKQENVVPYFQPIYDNKEKKLNKFEALMRIPNKNGGILAPYQFLDIAKEYKLYYQLSNIMVRKVLRLFDDREEMVSINLSAYDINSEEFTGMLFREMSQLKHPNHFIFEILESEEFRHPEILEEFVQEARSFGVKIAIDDFGSGYSNLVEVAKLQPDLIKIDGQIVRYIQESEISRNLVDIIVFMSERMGIDLVAEFVKSKELQDYVAGKGIRYSQGYYFSPPVPYEKLDELIEKYNGNT
jgi:EAL domain-containing protein (putative c-di-GMP-specific phosphodiesterase class I)